MSFRGGLAGRVRKGGDAGGVETCAFKSSQSPVRALDNWPIGARGLAAGGEEPARVHPVAYAEAELPDLAAYLFRNEGWFAKFVATCVGSERRH